MVLGDSSGDRKTDASTYGLPRFARHLEEPVERRLVVCGRDARPAAGIALPTDWLRNGTCGPGGMSLGKAVVAGVGAKMLTGSLLGFFVVFALIYWLL